MKKTLHTIVEVHFFYVILIAFIAAITSMHIVFAAENMPRLVDEAELLYYNEETELLYKLDEISERQQVDIVVLTIPSLEGVSSMKYADDFYDNNGYGFGDNNDGILFLISMEERDWYISTTGYGIIAITDENIEYMSERFLNDLSEGEYLEAFTTFAELCDDFITQAKMNHSYNGDSISKKPYGFASNFAITFGIAFIISLIITGTMKRKLKTIHHQSAADIYIKKDSMRITRKNDLFLYRHIDRVKKPENNQPNQHSRVSHTHTSSSGRTHGGRGGKF
ncbi:TPM domain-containing protein [Lachnospiraceae bacterium 46-61]